MLHCIINSTYLNSFSRIHTVLKFILNNLISGCCPKVRWLHGNWNITAFRDDDDDDECIYDEEPKYMFDLLIPSFIVIGVLANRHIEEVRTTNVESRVTTFCLRHIMSHRFRSRCVVSLRKSSHGAWGQCV